MVLAPDGCHPFSTPPGSEATHPFREGPAGPGPGTLWGCLVVRMGPGVVPDNPTVTFQGPPTAEHLESSRAASHAVAKPFLGLHPPLLHSLPGPGFPGTHWSSTLARQPGHEPIELRHLRPHSPSTGGASQTPPLASPPQPTPLGWSMGAIFSLLSCPKPAPGSGPCADKSDTGASSARWPPAPRS